MATADLDFNLKISGTPEEVESILKIMLEYYHGKDGVYFSLGTINVDDKEFRLSLSDKDEILSAARSGEAVSVHTMGPFGKYGEIDEVDIFRDMAQAAPNASFTASINGFAGYADQSLHANLANGLLKVSTSYLSDDCRGEGEFEYYSAKLPYDKFIEIFKLDEEEFDKEMYEDFMNDNFCCYDYLGEFFEETEYEDFLELFDEVECPLTEDEYDEIAEQFADMDDESCTEYLESEGFTACENYTYDPVEKKYIDGRGPKMKSGVAYSINGEIRAYLDSIGQPSDDEAINALSVEDVYAIMAGTYGKEELTEDEECESDEDEDEADECEVEEEISEDLAEEDSDDDDSDDDDSDEQDTVESETDTDEIVSEAVTADTAVTEPETAEEEIKSPARKKSFPVWIIVLLIVMILIGVTAYVFDFDKKLFDYIANLLGTAARLL